MSIVCDGESIYWDGPRPERPANGDQMAAYLAAEKVDEFVRVGSRETCNPAPTDTDEDFLCLVNSVFEFIKVAKLDGFEPYSGSHLMDESEVADIPEFVSMRRGDMNIIATSDEEFYKRFKAASSVAKRFNLLDKADRIALFQAVLYGNSCQEGAKS